MKMDFAKPEQIRAFKGDPNPDHLISRVRYVKGEKESSIYLAIPYSATIRQLQIAKLKFFTEGGIFGRSTDYIDVPWAHIPDEAKVLLLTASGPLDTNWDEEFEMEDKL